MTGFMVAALLFVLLFMGLLITALQASPGSSQSGATHSGRDGARKVRDDFDQRARTTVLADNPPGTPSVPHPRGSGSTSAS